MPAAPSIAFDPLIADFLAHLRTAGRPGCATSYGKQLMGFQRWLTDQQLRVTDLTELDLLRYQEYLRRHHRTPTGEPLADTTRASISSIIVALCRWLYRTNRVLGNPAEEVDIPHAPRQRSVRSDHLSVQEVIALIQTQGQLVRERQEGSAAWVKAWRDLALVSVAIATGRRAHGLLRIRVADIDWELAELRVPEEKASLGRVLPMADWAVHVVRRYVEEARPLLVVGIDDPWLYPGEGGDHLGYAAYAQAVEMMVTETTRRCPDLTELSKKDISTHSLRVSFASTSKSQLASTVSP